MSSVVHLFYLRFQDHPQGKIPTSSTVVFTSCTENQSQASKCQLMTSLALPYQEEEGHGQESEARLSPHSLQDLDWQAELFSLTQEEYNIY